MRRLTALRPLLSMAVFAFLLVASLSAVPALAQGPDTTGLQAVGQAAGIAGSSDLMTIIGRIIYVALSFVGIILLGLLIYAGYLWMTSGGDATKIDQAKAYIRNAIIGLVIIVSSFAITSFIMAQLAGVTGSGGGTGTSSFGNGFNSFPDHAGSLGAGIIESHLPQRNATGVPRNTPIVITFKEPIRLNSFIKGWTDANSSTMRELNDLAIKIYRIDPTAGRQPALLSTDASVRYTADRKTFVIRPVELLGNPTSDTDYIVELIGGTSGILLDDGKAAFSGTFGGGYEWPFQVSTLVDNTPPRIETIIPSDSGTFAPNVVIQVNFNEPVDPTAAGGVWSGSSGFTNIEVRSTPETGPDVQPSGEFRVSNGYRTVEFTTNLACGTNSCGNTIYCLPGSSAINVHVKSATLSSPLAPQALLNDSGYDGIVDMVGNALDGNENGTSEGPGQGPEKDDYSWSFGTTAEPNLTAPRIESTLPPFGDDILSSNIPMDSKPVASFDSVLQSSTVNSDTVKLQTNEPEAMADTFWWSLSQEPLTAEGVLVVRPAIASKGRLMIDHRIYSILPPSTPPGGIVPIYQPIIKSGVQNIYQNCFNPAGPVVPAQCTGTPSSNCCHGEYSTTDCPSLAPTSISP